MRVSVQLVGCAYVSMQCVNAAKHELLCTGELSSLYFGSGLHVQALMMSSPLPAFHQWPSHVSLALAALLVIVVDGNWPF